jgi:hypothetical protein
MLSKPPWLSIVDLHNLSIDGVDKDIMLCPKSQENHYTKSSSWASVTFPEVTRRLNHYIS